MNIELAAFAAQEPLKENRFIIKIKGADIHSYLFRKYKIFNEGDDLIFTTSFYETVNYCFNPVDFFKIYAVSIEYLDPTGVVVNSLEFDVKGSNFERKQSYRNDKLQINKLRFVVDKKTMNLKYVTKNISDAKQGND